MPLANIVFFFGQAIEAPSILSVACIGFSMENQDIIQSLELGLETSLVYLYYIYIKLYHIAEINLKFIEII